MTCGNWEGTLVPDGAGCDFCMYVGQYNSEVRSLQTIYSPVLIGRGLSSLKGRGVISVTISDNIINEVRSQQTIH